MFTTRATTNAPAAIDRADWTSTVSFALRSGPRACSSTRDPRDPPDVIPGCGAIVPKAHRASPSDLTAHERAATRELLLPVRAELHKQLAPDGYTLGWNDQGGLHPHLHVIPRFDDEPMAGHGVRSGIKDPANRRPEPWRPGTGRHMARS